jgi:hypothetical protein
MHYQYVDLLVQGLAADAKNLIDLGSVHAQCVEKLHWRGYSAP